MANQYSIWETRTIEPALPGLTEARELLAVQDT